MIAGLVSEKEKAEMAAVSRNSAVNEVKVSNRKSNPSSSLQTENRDERFLDLFRNLEQELASRKASLGADQFAEKQKSLIEAGRND